ncbi:uncharacterized protein N7479_000993 [Penicillium vulpinum]|uniref:Nucleoporin NUP37 n=1 Tax=Penicillium vulpinum TaxID=29845 RepID=A0A1V6RH18_9EURO|nr:uncharacterized protein N7479_000993 [Penicillium vulpinum]KAJ5971075.1 hypothetical protein N7479_000993 [Penicillium vulpinum]OQE00798.1 hypothetical protein PENVUL_c046G04187 [Penicillium vulpinum]
MPSFPTTPLVRAREDGLQISYPLSHRIHTAKGYPLRSPNGSSVIIYGYDAGLKIVWRGGKRFAELKPTGPQAKPKPTANNADPDSVMIIDSGEEEEPEPAQEEPVVEFSLEESEVDPAAPYEAILRQIDIPLGSRVLDVAVPRVLPEEARSPLDPFPPMLRNTIVVSVVCSDLSTKVVTLPIIPPHPTRTDSKSWRIQTLTVNGATTHQDIPRGLSITFTCHEFEDEQDQRKLRGRFGNFGKWDLLVATHSGEGCGALLLHRIPIRGESSIRIVEEDIVSQRRLLPAPAQTIAFNPSTWPSTRHANLLVAFHSGCVKIYSCFAKKVLKSSRRASILQEDYENIDTEGRWLISLYPGFEQGPTGVPQRKRIIDADWVLGGRAVMVLLEDGEWGVWDIEGAGPGAVKGPLHRQTSVQGVTGGSLTAYAVCGRIMTPLSNTNSETEQRSRFAPMTPSTRRVREDGLLKGSMSTASPSHRGQISVLQTNPSSDALPDESILLRHGRQSAIITSLLSLWRNAVKTTGTFDSSNRCRVSPFQDVNLMGQNFQAIGHLPAPARRSRQAERQAFDVLVVAEHQIMILAPKLTESVEESLPIVKQEEISETDQLMLRRGELDVEGMGRLLNGMAGGNVSMRMGSPVKRTRVFA